MAEWYFKMQRTVVGGVLRPVWSRTWDLRGVVGVTRHYQTVYTPLPPSCDEGDDDGGGDDDGDESQI